MRWCVIPIEESSSHGRGGGGGFRYYWIRGTFLVASRDAGKDRFRSPGALREDPLSSDTSCCCIGIELAATAASRIVSGKGWNPPGNFVVVVDDWLLIRPFNMYIMEHTLDKSWRSAPVFLSLKPLLGMRTSETAHGFTRIWTMFPLKSEIGGKKHENIGKKNFFS